MGGTLLTLQVLAFVVPVVSSPTLLDENGLVLGRDLLPFYAAGKIVASGNGAHLYEFDRQAAAQRAILVPERRDGTAYFANPAFVAAAYAPLSSLPYRAAILVHAAAMAAAVAAGCASLARHLSVLQHHWRLAAVLSLAWLPMYNAISGGQNPGLSFALLAAVYVGTRERNPLLAGTALGLLAYKPQLVMLPVLLLGCAREFRSLIVAGGVGVLLFIVGALCCGLDWPVQMIGAVSFFSSAGNLGNSATLIGLPQWFEFAAGQRELGFALALVLVGALVLRWRRARPCHAAFPAQWAAMASAIPLTSLHAQHYEVALLLLPILLLLDLTVARAGGVSPALRAGLLLLFLVYPSFLLGRRLGFQPLGLVPPVILIWALREERRASVPSR